MSVDFKQILAEGGLPTTEESIEEKFDELVAEEGFITNTSSVSPFWRLIKAVAIEPFLWLVERLSGQIMPNLFVKTASGQFLDILCEGIGLNRKAASKAQGVIHFTKTDVNTTVTVKKGTVVQSERINETVYKLLVLADTVIPAGIKTAPVAVIAEQGGTNYNLSRGYYRILPEAVFGISHVENLQDWLITPAGDAETDEELRERYRVQFSSVGKHHIDSVYKSMIAEIAGLAVDRIYFKHDAPRGPGTANVYLLLDTGQTSQAFIEKVNNHIADGYHGHGDDLQCFAMPESLHDLNVTFFLFKNAGLSDAETALILSECEAMIRCAFRENNDFTVTKTYPFQRFSFSKLGEELHEKFPEIESIEWGQADILNGLSIPRIQSLTITRGNE